MNIEKKEETSMCTQCKMFFGSESNGWLCSSCFKYSSSLPKEHAEEKSSCGD